MLRAFARSGGLAEGVVPAVTGYVLAGLCLRAWAGSEVGAGTGELVLALVVGTTLDIAWATLLHAAVGAGQGHRGRWSSRGITAVLVVSAWLMIVNLQLLRIVGSPLDPFVWGYVSELSNVGFATSVATEAPWGALVIQLIVATSLVVYGAGRASSRPDPGPVRAWTLVLPSSVALVAALVAVGAGAPGASIAGSDGLTWVVLQIGRPSPIESTSPATVATLLRPELGPGEVYWSEDYPLVRGTPRALCRADLLDSCTPESEGSRSPLPDVVILQLESLPAWVLPSLGGRDAELVAPNLERLAERTDARLFTDHESNSSQTAPGLVALLCSMWPHHGTMLTRLRPPMRCLPEILEEEGYTTHALIAGDAWFDAQGEFLTELGIDRVEVAEDVVQATGAGPRLDWGATDEALFIRVAQVIAAPQSRPRLVFAQTVGNHHPYQVPTPLSSRDPEHPVHSGADEANARATSAYADWSLGPLLDALEGAAGRTDRGLLVVIIGDNGHPRDTRSADRFTFTALGRDHVHTPLILWAPGRPELLSAITPEITSFSSSTVDVLPTILGLLGLESAHASAGVDLTRTRPRETFATVAASGGLIRLRRDGMVLMMRLFPPRVRLFAGSDDDEQNLASDVELTRRMAARAQAHASAVNRLVEHNKIWPRGARR